MNNMKSLLPTIPVSIDVETEEIGIGASLEFYRENFRVKSLAISFQGPDNIIYSEFAEGEQESRTLLEIVKNNPIVVHNLSFEYGVMLCRFPDIKLNWHSDTMRMVQVADNGGLTEDSEEKSIDDEIAALQETKETSKKTTGLSLEASVFRWLDKEHHNHKKPYYDYLIQNFPESSKKPGIFLHLLPLEMLKSYNTKDTEITLLLYKTLDKYFKHIKYDYRQDHDIYIEITKLTSESKIHGVKIDQKGCNISIDLFQTQLVEMSNKFNSLVEDEIRLIELDNIDKYLNARSSIKGKASALLKIKEDPSSIKFNINSTKQKETLFVDKLGIKPKFFTKKGAPSFKKSVLSQWGEGGMLLKQRGTVNIAKNQCEKLLSKSEFDGRWHIDIRSAGTTTGRMKGDGGLNIQGMSRKEPLVMSRIESDLSHCFVSVDLTSGEPSITAHFSSDPYYRAAVLDMINKTPYYDSQGVLLIDDIYLMVMSVSPMGKDRIKHAFYEEKFEGLSFKESWSKNPEIIKKILKKERDFHKILTLGIGYSMGAVKMVESAFEAGYTLSLEHAKLFVKAYWKLFKGVKSLSRKLENIYKTQGDLINPFGYRLVPDKTYKAFNYFIQSGVSGLINVLCIKFFSYCTEARFITVIHDEIIFQIPIDKKEECKEKFKKALDSLNEDLEWSVAIKTGWKEGVNFYEAK